jgi:hypothetical protein
MIFTCKQIAKKMADQKLHDASPVQRWWMKLHIKMCVVCGSYQQDAEKFQHAESKFAELEDDLERKLDDAFKQKLKEKMRNCKQADEK